MTTQRIARRTFLRTGLTGTALGAAAWAIPGVAQAGTAAGSPASVQVAKIYRLQAAFHRAKTTQDLELMMSLWAPDGYNGNPYSLTTSAAVGYKTSAEDDNSVKDSRAHSMAITRTASARTRKDHKQSFRVASVAGANQSGESWRRHR